MLPQLLFLPPISCNFHLVWAYLYTLIHTTVFFKRRSKIIYSPAHEQLNADSLFFIELIRLYKYQVAALDIFMFVHCTCLEQKREKSCQLHYSNQGIYIRYRSGARLEVSKSIAFTLI